MASPFDPRSPADVTALVRDYPLCWLVSGGGGNRRATPLPLLPEVDDRGGVRSLFGHIALKNPQRAELERDRRATVLCMGPQGYISPRLVSNPTWGPTWNYAVTRFEVDVAFVPDETDEALSRLAATLEAVTDDPWTTDRMGPRYDQLTRFIVAFRAVVRVAHPRFKLGQDESPGTFEEIVSNLDDLHLAEWMRRARD